MTTDLHLGAYTLSAASRELYGPDQRLPLGDRAFNILRLLAEQREEVVGKRELLAEAWSGLSVDEAALRFQIGTLRRILGECREAELRILNAAGRGYVLTVRDKSGAEAPVAAADTEVRSFGGRHVRLIGRDEDIPKLVNRLRSERLLTLIGPGGVGKTSIALNLASILIDDFRHVHLVDFSSVDDPSKALLSAATALNVTSGAENPIAAIVARFRRECVLLVLDNCEHVIDEVARLAEALLEGTSDVRVVATSREALRIADEQVYRVRPLSLPPASGSLSPAALLGFGAVRLFVDRAGARSGYQLTDEDAPAVSAICRQLDGIPLAIELAAGWIEAFPPPLLAADLQAHLLQGGGGLRGAPARHRTLDAMLRWSFDRLPEALQEHLARLAVFRGEFDLEAALCVVGGDSATAFDSLSQLVDRSLVEVRRTGSGAAYRLLFVLRCFAEERLRSSSFEDDARRRHAEVILDWIADDDPEPLHGSETSAWLARYGPMVDDLRAALEWALSPRGDFGIACQLAHDAALIWFRISLPFEGPRYLTEALRQAAQRSPRDAALELRLKAVCGALAIFIPGSAHLMDLWQEVEQAIDDSTDQTTRQLASWAQWMMSSRSGHYRRALDYACRFEALAHPSQLADRRSALRMRSLAYLGMGRLDDARHGLEEVVQAGRLHSPATRFQLDQTSSSLIYLARILWLQGDDRGAREAAERSVALGEATRHSITHGFALLYGLAQIAILTGDLDAAERAIETYEVGPAVIAEMERSVPRGFRGAALALRGMYAEAADLIGSCFDGGGMRTVYHYSPLLGGMCEALGRAGTPHLGLQYVDALLTRFGAEPEDGAVPDLKRARASLLLMRDGEGARSEALALLEDALAQSERHGSPTWSARIRAERTPLLGDHDSPSAGAALVGT